MFMDGTLFWDFDGTLVQANSKWSASMARAFASVGHDVHQDEIRKYMRKSYSWDTPETHYPDAVGYAWWEALFCRLLPLYYRYGLSEPEIIRVNGALRDQIISLTPYRLFDDTAKTLEQCSAIGYRNYMLSNNFPELADVADNLGIGKFFSGYAVSACIGYEKPRREIFEYALAIAENPHVCYMIGDNPEADICGGNSMGLTTILVHNESQHEADFLCKSLAEIPALLISRQPA